MKRSCIDFAPRVQAAKGMQRWIPVAAILLAVAMLVLWRLLPQANVTESDLVNGPIYPSSEEIQAADIVIRSLNNPWLDALEVLDDIFEKPADGALLSVEANVERMSFKVSGEARGPGVAQSIPSRLKANKSVAAAVLIGIDHQGSPSSPVLFTIEFRMRDPS